MTNVTQLRQDMPPAIPDWRANLEPARPSGFVGDERNIIIAMRSAPELAGLVRFNEFKLDVAFARSPPWRQAEPGTTWRENDDVMCTAWLQGQGVKVRSKGTVADCAGVVAQDHAFHPVRDYLGALTWDGTPRLDGWVGRYLAAVGHSRYLAAVGKRFLCSAVARIRNPGCQADHVLVIEGPQGIGKTSAARALAVMPDWFAGSLPDVHSKDAPIQLAGRWIIEIPELKAIRRTQVEAVKAFITETSDVFRPPYGRRAAQFPRQCVFIATTNEAEYLQDRTGNRRYWPVRATAVDLRALIADRDQLWAEAVALYEAGEPWHLTTEEAQLAHAEQRERVHVSELESAVADYLAQQLCDEVTVHEVLTMGLRLNPDEPGHMGRAKRLGPEVADALQRCGWGKVGRSRDDTGTKRTRYRRVDKVDKVNV